MAPDKLAADESGREIDTAGVVPSTSWRGGRDSRCCAGLLDRQGGNLNADVGDVMLAVVHDSNRLDLLVDNASRERHRTRPASAAPRNQRGVTVRARSSRTFYLDSYYRVRSRWSRGGRAYCNALYEMRTRTGTRGTRGDVSKLPWTAGSSTTLRSPHAGAHARRPRSRYRDGLQPMLVAGILRRV